MRLVRRAALSLAAILLLLGVIGTLAQATTNAPASGAQNETLASTDMEHGEDVSSRPRRWRLCQRIGWTLRQPNAPDHAEQLARDAFSKIEAVTGLSFEFRGWVDHVPHGIHESSPMPHPWTIEVAWVSRAEYSEFGTAVGIGGEMWSTVDGHLVEVTGYAVIDSTAEIEQGWAHGATDGAVLLHELAHALGVEHLNDSSQLMYPTTDRHRAADFGVADVAALRAALSDEPCT